MCWSNCYCWRRQIYSCKYRTSKVDRIISRIFNLSRQYSHIINLTIVEVSGGINSYSCFGSIYQICRRNFWTITIIFPKFDMSINITICKLRIINSLSNWFTKGKCYVKVGSYSSSSINWCKSDFGWCLVTRGKIPGCIINNRDACITITSNVS